MLSGWPASAAMIVLSLEDGMATTVHREGDVDTVRPWASVSKVAIALAIAVEVEWGFAKLDRPAGPQGASLAHLLSHASGLGLEVDSPTVPAGTRRVYSNVGIDLAVGEIHTDEPNRWLADRVFDPLGLASCELRGRPSSGVSGSLVDLATLGEAWCRGDLLSRATHARFTQPFLPELWGVTPGFGSFDPNPWGLGLEIHGTKNHWMGSVPSPRAYGHFGQSSAQLLVDPECSLVVAAASDEPFGPWAHDLWPTWIDTVFSRFATE